MNHNENKICFIKQNTFQYTFKWLSWPWPFSYINHVTSPSCAIMSSVLSLVTLWVTLVDLLLMCFGKICCWLKTQIIPYFILFYCTSAPVTLSLWMTDLTICWGLGGHGQSLKKGQHRASGLVGIPLGHIGDSGKGSAKSLKLAINRWGNGH